MTWIHTIPFSEADEELRQAMEGQKPLYPQEYAVPIHPADGGKAIGRGRMIAIHNVQRSLPHLHGDIHPVFHAASIHNGEHVFRVHRVQMIVIIDHWKARLFDRVHHGLKR